MNELVYNQPKKLFSKPKHIFYLAQHILFAPPKTYFLYCFENIFYYLKRVIFKKDADIFFKNKTLK
jgi:hypothetical protein